MDRRRFLELVAAVPALTTSWAAGFKGAVVGKMRPVPASLQLSQPAVGQTGFMLSDLLASRTMPLGTLRSHRFYVSVDDIESEDYLGFTGGNRNALVISAYISEDGSDGALLRAVLAKLRKASPDDYKNLRSRFSKKSNPLPKRVVPFELKIPSERRNLFPVDDLVVVPFESGPSAAEDFEWVKSTFEIAEKQDATNLIVPA